MGPVIDANDVGENGEEAGDDLADYCGFVVQGDDHPDISVPWVGRSRSERLKGHTPSLTDDATCSRWFGQRRPRIRAARIPREMHSRVGADVIVVRN